MPVVVVVVVLSPVVEIRPSAARKSVVEGKRVDLGGRRCIKLKLVSTHSRSPSDAVWQTPASSVGLYSPDASVTICVLPVPVLASESYVSDPTSWVVKR